MGQPLIAPQKRLDDLMNAYYRATDYADLDPSAIVDRESTLWDKLGLFLSDYEEVREKL